MTHQFPSLQRPTKIQYLFFLPFGIIGGKLLSPSPFLESKFLHDAALVSDGFVHLRLAVGNIAVLLISILPTRRSIKLSSTKFGDRNY